MFFQKRESISLEEPSWLETATDENGIFMNRYFMEHPEMIMGKMTEVSGPYGPRISCRPQEGASFEEQMAEAVRRIRGRITPAVSPKEADDAAPSLPADPAVRNYSYTVVGEQVYYRVNSRMEPVQVSAAATARIKGMAAIRDCVRGLLAMQMAEGTTDGEITAAQEQLNVLYDTYTAAYGVLGNPANKRAFSDDSSYCLLCSLEILDGEGKFQQKADIFTKRTIRRAVPVTRVDTAAEALALSLNELAEVDLAYMADLAGKTPEEITEELAGVIFQNPSSGRGRVPVRKCPGKAANRQKLCEE